MSLHLVTGHAGREHITPADHGAFYNALLLSGSYVLNSGNNFSASVITNNTIKISDGELIMQGRHVRMKPGEYEEVTIENGAQESTRNDLIVARYVKDGTTGIENVSFVVIKGTSVASNPSDPAHIEGNILNGVLTADFPLYRVPLNGLNVGELVPLFEVKDSFDKRINEILDGTQKVGSAKAIYAGEPFDGTGMTIPQLQEYISNWANDLIYHANAVLCIRLGFEWVGMWNRNDTVNPVGWGHVWNIHKLFFYSGSDGMYLATNGNGLAYYINCAEGVWSNVRQITTLDDLINYLPKTGGQLESIYNVALSLKNGVGLWSLLQYEDTTGILGHIGFSEKDRPIIVNAEGSNWWDVLHTGNVADIPTVVGLREYLTIQAVSSSWKTNLIQFSNTAYFRNANGNDYYDIAIGTDGSFRCNSNINGNFDSHLIHHDGNSAKVVISQTAPSDTSDLWVY